MAEEITISIDTRAVRCGKGSTIIEAADRAGIYIPRLCYHPALPPGSGTKSETRVYRCGESIACGNPDDGKYSGCNICIVAVEGKGTAQSCTTLVEDGMVINSDTPAVREARRDSLARMISNHPHACILCAEKEGCDREECTLGVEKNERCCSKFDDCEFRKVCEYVTIRDDVSKYICRDIPVVETALFTFNPNMCIGCARCIRACEKTHGTRVINFVYRDGKFILGTVGRSYNESGCQYCGACVVVCPTGALLDKGLAWKKKEKLNIAPVVLPPENDLELNEENIYKVPEESGVYLLLNEKREILYIRGTDNMRKDLMQKWQSVEKSRFFRYEEYGMYSMRENEMLEKYLKKFGSLPEVNNEIDDLY